MEYVKLTKQLNPKVIDGRVYVDFDALIEALFKSAEASSQMARDLHDPALGLMAMGQTATAQVLESSLYEIQRENDIESR
ncbi:hypothetical protein PP459_gp037 [Streptomyces phage Wakanda]|uniref:Uncharacterized protein n=2 Tax=Wakandavirus TaxID=3044854 RepID=A0A6G8R3K9_9CAUD|nr:hypothetical protein PP459_gp037 [Streptomyces phage Wakanda]YP_010652519.1 hypothetical protein PP460_gp039 [Streptomyces phage Muntaha]QIN94196.1 hypothetical protein SEA_WAKANDA_236 [Streptomyces phage Wakanda]QIN94763.1 hypothetical protein SEA_MUNTAHA_240 [Streptomyces phage Muntaha]